MDANASLGRFYAFTTNTSPTLPSTASSPDPQYRRDSSGSDSVSDDDGGALQRPHQSGRAPPGYGGGRVPYATQNPPPFLHNRADSAPATVYVDDPPYIPPGSSRPIHSSHFVETGPDVPFNPPAPTFNQGFPPSMSSTTLPPTTFRRDSGGSSPTGSNGSVRSDRSGGHSVSSQGSASSGVVSNGSIARDPLLQGHDVFPPQQRVAVLPGYNPDHYPAYDEHFRRVGMEHARFGTEPPQHPDNAYYRPRTHTYPPVGVSMMSMGMESQELGMASFSPEMHLMSMPPDDMAFGRDTSNDPLMSNNTIYVPPAAAPQSYSHSSASSSQGLRVGDDAYIPTSDDDVRRILGLNPDQEISLNALADPPDGGRPGQSIPTLSQLAILGSPLKRLTLQEIYQALEDRFEWFRLNTGDKSWQNSIRHNLSLYKCFRRVAKPITEPGKGSYWVVDYSRGAGTKRPRKRNKRPTKAQLRAEKEAQEAQEAQEARDAAEANEEGESSPDGEEDNEGFPSPAQATQDIVIDPLLQAQGHQVGYGRTRISTRSMARRANSPYAQAPPVPQARRQTAPSPFPAISQTGSRNPSATFGQPSFGQPSLGPPGIGALMFAQGNIGARNWQPGMPMHPQAGPTYLPPPQPRPVGRALAPPDAAQGTHRGSPLRAHTLPMPSSANMGHAMMRGQPSFPQLPPLAGIDQLRDGSSGRFVARGTAAATQVASQHYVEGPSRAGRRPSLSSNSSRE